MGKLIASVFVLIWLSLSAYAETAAGAITRWGLLGTWMVQCGPPLSPADQLSYAIRQGKPVHNRNLRDGGEETFNITRAAVAPDQTLELQINYGSKIGVRDLGFIRGPDKRIRVKYNRKSDGTYVIFDGKFVANGALSVWQARCP
ncbi:MAG: hypothetical protein ABI830_03645 [Pseudolabrys sp.]